MKLIKNPNGALTFLLIALLVISCFWIVKSEIRAASLQSRLEEHHKQLAQNADYLKGLTGFLRSAGMNKLHFDKETITINSGNTKLTMHSDGVKLGVSDFLLQMTKSLKEFGLYAYPNLGMTLSLIHNEFLLKNHGSSIKLKKNDINIVTKGDISIGPTGRTLGYSKSGGDYLYMDYDDETRIYLGKLVSNITGKGIGKGISLQAKWNGPMIQVRENMIVLETPDSKYKLFIDPANQLVGMRQGESSITIKKDNVDIEALGDINITSKNGKVNINGKR
jgi:hypothetical protein